jgi:hypothetical protein
MRKVIVVGSVVLTAGLVLSATWAQGAGEFAGTAVQVPPAVIPSLTAADRQIASQAVAASPMLNSSVGQGVTGGLLANATLEGEGIWHQGAAKLGVVRLYRTTRPLDVTLRTWPSIDWPSGSSAYVAQTLRFSVTDLSSFEVLVDTQQRSVVAVDPVDSGAYAQVDTTGYDMTLAELGE